MTPIDPGPFGQTGVLVKTGSGRILDLFVTTPSSSADTFLQFFDAAELSDVTIGTDTPKFQMRFVAAFTYPIHLNLPGIFFQKGIVIAATGNRGGNNAPPAPAECVFFVE